MADLEFFKGGQQNLLQYVTSSRSRAFATLILQEHLNDSLLIYVDQIETLTGEQLNAFVACLYLYGFDENSRAKESCLPKRGTYSVPKTQLVKGLKEALNLTVRHGLAPIAEESGE